MGDVTQSNGLNTAPGSVVVVRDEEWLVTKVTATGDGQMVSVQGLSDLVRGTSAVFYEAIDHIHELDPAAMKPLADGSSQYRRARLWLEAMLRKSPVPLSDVNLHVSDAMLADPMLYQQQAVRSALNPEKLRPRLLLADAVGLGKTLEIGMILSELVRRGRGDAMLVVTPRHVLEQMQHELWCRFALPFVRLDSTGLQQVRQKLPATRNPFTMYKRAIISMDTLKSERYVQYLRNHRWDAVVIDESHNVTNSGTQNNRLAVTLAPTTDALILASATPHNGRASSFAELVRLLEPAAVSAAGEVAPADARRLVIRRHRHSPEVAREVGGDWKEREEPINIMVPASAAENAVARELNDVWLRPTTGSSPSVNRNQLFPWTLAKAFLSSPAALAETVRQRLKSLAGQVSAGDMDAAAGAREEEALRRLEELAVKVTTKQCAKFGELVEYAKRIGVGAKSEQRMVVFAERVATLEWLHRELPKALGLKRDAVDVMHGGLPDVEQQQVVERFKRASTPVRVLVTGDVASEGVNLHSQCHDLVHFDVPWSLIRLEQRNGRVDRYGQRHSARIATLLLTPDCEEFAGDVRVLTRLVEKEHTAHVALGDAASLMGEYNVAAEEKAVMQALRQRKDLDDIVSTPEDAAAADPLLALMDMFGPGAEDEADDGVDASGVPGQQDPVETSGITDSWGGGGVEELQSGERSVLYPEAVDFLRDALKEAYEFPERAFGAGGVGWSEHPQHGVVEFVPPPDLKHRLGMLPQSYVKQRKVLELLKLVTDRRRATDLLRAAQGDASVSSWPEAHFLGPLHPVLDWAGDRALASLGRGQIFAVRGAVDRAAVLMTVLLTNRRGHVEGRQFSRFQMHPEFGLLTLEHKTYRSAGEMLADVGMDQVRANPGPPLLEDVHSELVQVASDRCREMSGAFQEACERSVRDRVERWMHRAQEWGDEADTLMATAAVAAHRVSVVAARGMAENMLPERVLVRPLLLVLPQDHPVAVAEPAAAAGHHGDGGELAVNDNDVTCGVGEEN